MLFSDNYSEKNEEEGPAKRARPFILESDPHDEETNQQIQPAEQPKKAAPPKPIVTLKISAAPNKSAV